MNAATDETLDRYCVGLNGTTLGPLLIGRHIRSDLDWLLTRDSIDDKVDEFAGTFTAVVRSRAAKITVDTDRYPRRTVVRVFHELRDLPDTHVVVRSATGRKHTDGGTAAVTDRLAHNRRLAGRDLVEPHDRHRRLHRRTSPTRPKFRIVVNKIDDMIR